MLSGTSAKFLLKGRVDAVGKLEQVQMEVISSDDQFDNNVARVKFDTIYRKSEIFFAPVSG